MKLIQCAHPPHHQRVLSSSYIYIYTYMHTFRYSEFYVNLKTLIFDGVPPSRVSPSSIGGREVFSKKSFSWGNFFGKFIRRESWQNYERKSRNRKLNLKNTLCTLCLVSLFTVVSGYLHFHALITELSQICLIIGQTLAESII